MKRFSSRSARRARLCRPLGVPFAGLGLIVAAGVGSNALPINDPPAPGIPPPVHSTPPLSVSGSAPSAIGQIIVLGNRTLSQTAIVLMSGHKEGDPCTRQALDEMRVNLLQKGYFGLHSSTLDDAVRVTVEQNALPDGRCKVVIQVDENDVVDGVNVRGAGPIKVSEIIPLLHLSHGSVYNPIQFRRDYFDIQQLYNKRGFTVTPADDAGFDEHGNLNVDLNVARVTEIQVTGNRKTRKNVILREMQTRKNGFVNNQTLEEDRLRLLNLGLFEKVIIEARTLGNGQIGLTVQVEEKKVASVLGSFSYSAVDKLVGGVQYTDSNFRGSGESVGVNADLGLTTGRHSVSFDYRKPWLDNRQTGMSLQLYDKSVAKFADGLYNANPSGTGSQGGQYVQQRTGGSLTLSRPLGQAMRAALTVRGEETRTDPLNLVGTNAAIIQDGPLYAIGSQILRDTRDLVADPTRGSVQSLSVSFGHADLHGATGSALPDPYVFGSHNYGKSALDYHLYWSPFRTSATAKPGAERTTMALRLQAGGSTGKLPFAEQYFLGGGETLRGYREDRFWGSNQLLGSIELRQPVAPKFKLVGFVDVGDAWGGNYAGVNIAGFSQHAFQAHIGTGVGIRVGTPVGMLRLDLGFGDEGSRLHFGFGGTF